MKLEEELLLAMEKNLLLKQGSIKQTNIEQATNYLKAAKEIFEEKGYNKQANHITYLLSKIAVIKEEKTEEMHPSRAFLELTTVAKKKNKKMQEEEDQNDADYKKFMNSISNFKDDNIDPEFKDLLSDKNSDEDLLNTDLKEDELLVSDADNIEDFEDEIH